MAYSGTRTKIPIGKPNLSAVFDFPAEKMPKVIEYLSSIRDSTFGESGRRARKTSVYPAS